MPPNPLLEVFGYPADDMSEDAVNHRAGRWCPFHNSSGLNCTKNSVLDPLGVCSIKNKGNLAIVCPVRLRQDRRIYADAAEFFFPGEKNYRILTEVELNDDRNKSAGNIDAVLVALDERSQIKDFGALEVQAVYVSGNIGNIFHDYMRNPAKNFSREWPGKGYPRPDYLSSSRKRLAPQLIYKGNILQAWNKKVAVAVHAAFFNTLPELRAVSADEADMGWFVYDLLSNERTGRYELKLNKVVYTRFQESLNAIAYSKPGKVTDFIQSLQSRIDQGKMMGVPPSPELPPSVLPPIDLTSILNENDNGDDIQLESPL